MAYNRSDWRGKITKKLKLKTCGKQTCHSSLNKAFTLTEIVLLLGIIGIFISGILPLFLNVITVNKSSEYYSKAYKIMDSKIEEFRNTDFDSVTTQNFSVLELPSGQGSLTVTNNVDNAPQTDIKKLDLTISWTFRKTTQIRTVTYIARGGLK